MMLNLLRGSSIYSVAILVNAASRFAVLAIGARVLGLDEYGSLDSLIYLSIIVSSVILLGMDSAVIRFAFGASENVGTSDGIFTTALVLIGAILAIVVAVFSGLTIVVDFSFLRMSNFEIVVCLSLFGAGFSLTAICGASLRAHFRETHFLIATILAVAVRFGTILPFLFVGTTSLGIFFVFTAIGYFLSGLVYLVFTIRNISLDLVSTKSIRTILRFGVPLSGIMILSNLTPLMERLIVLSASNSETLSVYAASAIPAMILGLGLQVINMTWGPLAFQAHEHGRKAFIARSALFLQVCFIAAYLFCLFFSNILVNIIAPIEADNPAAYFPFIGMIMVVRLTASFTSMGLIVSKRTEFKLMTAISNFAIGGGAAYVAGLLFGVGSIPIALFVVAFAIFFLEAMLAERIEPEFHVPYQLMSIVILATSFFAWLVMKNGG